MAGTGPRRALVTGAGGFVGSHLVQALARDGCEVRGFVRYTSAARAGWLETLPPSERGELEIVAGDLRDAEAVHRACEGVDAVFHLGALVGIPYSYVHLREVVETNVTGTLNVLVAARDRGVSRLLYASTSEVYGGAQYAPMDEAHPLSARSPYAATKVGGEKLAESFQAAFGLPVVVLRPFNMYGPRQSARAVIPTIITQALAGREIRLGNTTTTRDFTYVEDTVAAFVRAACVDDAVGRTFNLGSGTEISIGDLVAVIRHLIGDASGPVLADPSRHRPAASEVSRLIADSRLASEVLGWRPAVGLEEGLRRTIAWIRQHLGEYRVGRYEV
jgi:NAD dependent epimerase/dehydratase